MATTRGADIVGGGSNAVWVVDVGVEGRDEVELLHLLHGTKRSKRWSHCHRQPAADEQSPLDHHHSCPATLTPLFSSPPSDHSPLRTASTSALSSTNRSHVRRQRLWRGAGHHALQVRHRQVFQALRICTGTEC
jgi:hypothetical protein